MKAYKRLFIVEQYISGKSVREIINEYKISESSAYKWINNHNNYEDNGVKTELIIEKQNGKEYREYDKEILRLRAEYEAILKENEILKKTISIFIK